MEQSEERGKKRIHEPQTRARENSVSFKGLDGVDTCIQIQHASDGNITFCVF
jgi:hypothetical protein